jgi:galactonate dehydratase
MKDTQVCAVALWSATVPVSEKTAWIFLRITLSDGTEGWGEASAFGNELAVEGVIAALAAQIARDRPPVVAPVLALLSGRQSNPARDVVRTAVEAALFDALARRADLPLAVFLGGQARSEVRAYANLNRGILDRSPAGFARAASLVVAEEGYEAVKVAPFDAYLWDGDADPAALERGIARIAAVRDAVGPSVRLLVDCHGRFSPAAATTMIQEVAALHPFWIEEPLDSARSGADAQRSLRTVAHRLGIMIAGGEEIETMEDAQRLLVVGAHDVILPDLRQTGVRRGMAILELAVANGVMASLHNPAGPVLDALSRHVALAASSILILERQVRESPLYSAIGGSVALTAGCVGPGEGAGLGMAPDTSVLAAASGRAAAQVTFKGLAGAGPDA